MPKTEHDVMALAILKLEANETSHWPHFERRSFKEELERLKDASLPLCVRMDAKEACWIIVSKMIQ